MKSKLFLFLFALPFFSVGVWMAYSIGSNVYDARAMQAWQAVDARLLDAGYETHRGDESDTYEAYAKYAYVFAGAEYVNDRVGIASGGDNIGDYHVDTGSHLAGMLTRGQPLTVFVNPADPADAVIDRYLRWELIGFKAVFLLLFGGVGAGMLVYVFVSPGQPKEQAHEFANRPWLANDKWQTPLIRSSSRSAMWFAWGFAIFWNLVSAPLPFLVYGEILDKQNYLALLGLLFPLIGIGLLTWAVRNTREWTRFGPAPVALDPFPGSIGGHVGGSIDVRLPFDPNARFDVSLTCLYSYMSGGGRDRSHRETAKWQDSQIALSSSGSSGTRVVFRFDVPADLDESVADPVSDAYHVWRLNVQASLPGADFDRSYDVPVYQTAQQSQLLPAAAVDTRRREHEARSFAAFENLVQFRHGEQGRTMYYPMGRHLTAGVAGTLVGGTFAAIGLYLVLREGQWIIGTGFSLVGSLICLFSLYSISNSLEITQAGMSLRSVRRVLGVVVSRKDMLKRDFVRFRRSSGMQTTSGGKHVVYYTVSAVDRNGDEITVAESLRGASMASAAAQVLEREFGLVANLRAADTSSQSAGLDYLAADR